MSESIESGVTPEAAPDSAPGAVLRRAREARGISLAEAARMLKLAPRQIEAIEASEFDKLPGLAWVRGFVRNYARFLELDPAPLLAQMEMPARVADLRLAPESNAAGTVPSSPDGYRSHTPLPALLLAAAVVIVGLLAWHFDLASLIERKAAPQEEAPLAAASEPVFPPHTDETAVVTAQTEEALAANAAAPDAGASAPQTAGAPPRAAASAPAAVASALAGTVGAGEGSLKFAFTETSWVQVRDASGKVIFSRNNNAGDQQEVRGTPPFAIVVGNAPSVTLTFNGQPVDLKAHTKVTVARFSLK